MLIVVVDRRTARHDRADVFCLHLLEYPGDVFGNVLAESEDGAVAYGAIGAQESYDRVNWAPRRTMIGVLKKDWVAY